ncbi:MAG: hypothetical protein ABFD69_07180 [Candidatus Sumerlaeia bacterium]
MLSFKCARLILLLCSILIAPGAAAAERLVHLYVAGPDAPCPGYQQLQQPSLTLPDVFDRAQVDPDLLERKNLILHLVFLSPGSHAEINAAMIRNMMKHSLDWRDTDLLHAPGECRVIAWIGTEKELKRFKKAAGRAVLMSIPTTPREAEIAMKYERRGRAVKFRIAPGGNWPPQYDELMDLSKQAQGLGRWPGGESWNKSFFTRSKPAAPGEPISTRLALEDVQFGLLAAGPDKVWVKVRNLSGEPQLLGMHVQANSKSVGWGTQHAYEIAPRAEKWCTFVFKLHQDLDKNTNIRLSFADVKTADDIATYTLIKKYAASSLESRPCEAAKPRPAPPDLAQTITDRFIQIQESLRREEYAAAWRALSPEYQAVQFWGREPSFVREMQKTEPLSGWSRKDFVALQPGRVDWQGNRLVLNAAVHAQPWTVAFIKDGDWKIQSIAGYTDRFIGWNTWQERLLPAMTKATTRHFEIYAAKGSPAERDLERIKREREDGYREISKFLGVKTKQKIRLVFFDGRETKLCETGHQGMGMANGNLVVEVYNDSERLDPFHETAHVLARAVGDPPAIFTEGLAVFMSEQLGAPPLQNLGGGTASITARARELKTKNEWIDPAELLAYTDIGPEQSRPPVSYAEAASFDKYLIDTYGKAKFVEAYRTLKNSNDPATQRQNRSALERIYGLPFDGLVKGWYGALAPVIGPIGKRPDGGHGVGQNNSGVLR